jgi:hypothetical protein
MADGLNERYRQAGLDMDRYGYDVSIYQGIGRHVGIPKDDLVAILLVQLECIMTLKPTTLDWITPLLNATSVGEATEIFLVLFEGAENRRENPRDGDNLLYYTASRATHYQGADRRRDYAKIYYDMFKGCQKCLICGA